MRKHLTDDMEIRKAVFEGLKDNKSYCPCIVNSLGKAQYKCPCEDFRLNVLVGESCHCGLYIKDED